MDNALTSGSNKKETHFRRGVEKSIARGPGPGSSGSALPFPFAFRLSTFTLPQIGSAVGRYVRVWGVRGWTLGSIFCLGYVRDTDNAPIPYRYRRTGIVPIYLSIKSRSASGNSLKKRKAVAMTSRETVALRKILPDFVISLGL